MQGGWEDRVAEVGGETKKEEKNKNRARQVRDQRKRQESACRKGNRKEDIRKEIHEMNLILWGFVLNFGWRWF